MGLITCCLLRCKFGILFLGAGYFGFFTGKNLLFRPNLIFVPKSANQNYSYYFNNHCESRIFADEYEIFYNKRKIEILTFEKNIKNLQKLLKQQLTIPEKPVIITIQTFVTTIYNQVNF